MADGVYDPPTGLTIVLVEPDHELLRLAQGLFRANGHRVFGVSNLPDLLDIIDTCILNCVVLSFDAGGLDAIRRLSRSHPHIPVVVVSNEMPIGSVVEIVKAGAAEYLTKPYRVDDLLAHVEKAVAQGAQDPVGVSRLAAGEIPRGFQLLTGREHEVLEQIAGGASSKEVGRRLGISPRTVDVHRARIKEKLQVRRAVDLVRLVYDAKKFSAKS